MILKQTDIVKEYLNFLRNGNVLSISERAVTTLTDTFTTDKSGDLKFKLTKPNCKNIRKVTYDSVDLSFGLNYDFDLDKAEVEIYDCVPDKEIKINYDYGTEAVFGDFPRLDLTISSFPRVGFGVYGFRSDVGGFGNVLKSTWRFDVRVYATSSKQADEIIDKIRKLNIDNFVSLKTANRLIPSTIRDLSYYETEKGKHKIYVKGIDILVINMYEIN